MEAVTLTFHLAGINNQNFLMRDEETGTFWQQVNGKAISGPLRGKQLPLIHADELTFATWRNEEPNGTVLADVPSFASKYASPDWDVRMATVPVVVHHNDKGLPDRALILGLTSPDASRAYPVELVRQQKLINDHVGSEPVLLVTGPDNQSIRLFKRHSDSDEKPREFYLIREGMSNVADAVMMDSQTGSAWSFKGCAVAGPAAGTCLTPISGLQDYWFDWREYHPNTSIYRGR